MIAKRIVKDFSKGKIPYSFIEQWERKHKRDPIEKARDSVFMRWCLYFSISVSALIGIFSYFYWSLVRGDNVLWWSLVGIVCICAVIFVLSILDTIKSAPILKKFADDFEAYVDSQPGAADARAREHYSKTPRTQKP